jgi:hypothetical protein
LDIIVALWSPAGRLTVKSWKHKRVLVDEWNVSLYAPNRAGCRLSVEIAKVPAEDLPFVSALAKLLKIYLNRTR